MVPVSVIIPVYNGEAYLRQCIESVLASTLSGIEVIVVDDASTDGSACIAESYAGVIVIREEHRGCGGARNIGLRLATGEYVYFLDADDYIACDLLENVYREAQSKQLDGMLFNMQSVFETEELEATFKTWYDDPYKHIEYGAVLSGKEMFAWLERTNEYRTYVQRQLWRRTFLLEFNCWFPEIISHQDEYFSMRAILSSNRIECFAEDGVFRRYQSRSINVSSSRRYSYYCYFVVFCQIARMVCEEFGDVPEAKHQLEKLYYSMLRDKVQYEAFPDDGSFPDGDYLSAFAAYLCYRDFLSEKEETFDEKVLEQVAQADDIFLYGAGYWGERIFRLLTKQGLAIERFLVSSDAGNRTALCGTKVVSLGEYAPAIDKARSVIVVCVKNQCDAIVNSLRMESFQAVSYLDLLGRRPC